jgi:tetratricopeptide (TPR) repeat protein
MHISSSSLTFFVAVLIAISSCQEKKNIPTREMISELNLKMGEFISCAPADKQLGTVNFPISGSSDARNDFNLGAKLLHSFEYDEAEKVFAKIVQQEPGCAMAYWGVAMSNFHPLWSPPSLPELQKGARAVEIANSIKDKTKKEEDYINAVGSFYRNHEKLDHRTRCLEFEKAMEALHRKYPEDKEAAIFYALALNAAADPADKQFQRQKKAGTILNKLYPGEPDHPGIVHYIIHTYDAPELAAMALPAAKKYASIAPASPHALHMPSHIFTRLGLWDECINSNLASINSAKCYAEAAGIKGHLDEELHGMDYLVYAYLQKGENELAKKQWDYLNSMKAVHPANFKVAYAFASIPARIVLENKLWTQAASLKPPAANFSWDDYPWQNAITHFARLMGSVQTSQLKQAKMELDILKELQDKLLQQKDSYKANQVAIQMKMGEGWIRFSEGDHAAALALLTQAADMEDNTEKHPVTAGEVIPARECLANFLMETNQNEKALQAYEADLKKHPNRFNALYGAGRAAAQSGNAEKAQLYYGQLVQIAGNTGRQELVTAKQFLGKQNAIASHTK